MVRAPDEKQADEALAHAEEQLTTITTRHEKPEATHTLQLRSLEIAQQRHPEANLAFIIRHGRRLSAGNRQSPDQPDTQGDGRSMINLEFDLL